MRDARWLMSISGLLLVGAATWAMGCLTIGDDCMLTVTCPDDADAGAVNPACADEGEPMTNSVGPSEGCGIFVRPDAKAGGDGSKAKPLASLQAAIDKA